MSSKRYTDELKIEAVKQATERGNSVVDGAQRAAQFNQQGFRRSRSRS